VIDAKVAIHGAEISGTHYFIAYDTFSITIQGVCRDNEIEWNTEMGDLDLVTVNDSWNDFDYSRDEASSDCDPTWTLEVCVFDDWRND
jgi:hypothetical protein